MQDLHHDPEIHSGGERTLNDEYVYAAVIRPSVSGVSIGIFVPCGILTPSQYNSMTDRQVGQFHLSCTLISFLKVPLNQVTESYNVKKSSNINKCKKQSARRMMQFL